MVVVYLSINFIGLLIWHFYANKLVGIRFWSVLKDICPFLFTSLVAMFITTLITNHIDNLFLRFTLKIIITAIIYIAIMLLSNSVIVKECFYFIKHRKIKE
jgi:hypothetical protein